MARANILVVDDDEAQLKLFTSILEKNEYHVESAITGEEALELTGENDFNLAIIDIKLPDKTGDEVVREFRSYGKEMGVILITGYPSLQECINVLDLGIQEILLKPIDTEELLRVVEEALHPRVAA
jgi:DNA-binding response OmpR family regulator